MTFRNSVDDLRYVLFAIGLTAASIMSACGTSNASRETGNQGAAKFLNLEYIGHDDRFDQRVTDGQYLNPIISGFYPGPSVTRAGDYFYLVNPSFAYFPGIPIFRSKDLVDWEQIGHVLDRPDMVDMSGLKTFRGIFAPTIEFQHDTFYVTTICVDCGGNFVGTAPDPAGPWSDPIWFPGVGGIDPSIFFDEDERLYMVNNDGPVGEYRRTRLDG